MTNKTIIIVILLFIPILANARNFYLLSVGVSDYPGVGNDLRLPSADAKALSAVYKKSVGARVKVLTNNKATVNNIITEARNLFIEAQSDDVIIFFFSGHGVPGYFYVYDGALSFEEVKKFFADSKAKSKIMFVNSCFSGDIRRNSVTGYKNIGTDIMLFLSCRSDEYSYENPVMKNSFFVSCLVRCLKGGADNNKDRIITAKELFSAVQQGVIYLSDGLQHPVMWGNFSDNMQVINWEK